MSYIHAVTFVSSNSIQQKLYQAGGLSGNQTVLVLHLLERLLHHEAFCTVMDSNVCCSPRYIMWADRVHYTPRNRTGPNRAQRLPVLQTDPLSQGDAIIVPIVVDPLLGHPSADTFL